MKKHTFFYHFLLVCFLGLLSCANNNDDRMIIPFDDDMVEPNDSMEEEENEPGRTYTRENYTVGDWGLEIYIPSDYDSTATYPAIYCNDGDLYSDVFGYLTAIDAPPFIMIGISGNNSRAERFLAYNDPIVRVEFGDYTPSASVYSDAIVNEIIPFVEDKFIIDRNKKAFFGISLGGLHATWMAVEYPRVFSFIGAMSPSYWVANEAIFEENLSVLKPPGLSIPTKIYFDRGSTEWRNHLSFVERLKTVGLVYGSSLFYYEVIGASHAPEDWQLRVDIPFRIFLEGVGSTATPSKLELKAYCAKDLTSNNANTTRLNPIIHYEKGIKFSVMSEADYNITQGSGSIANDGTYTINSGSTLTVRATYKDLTDVETANDCN